MFLKRGVNHLFEMAKKFARYFNIHHQKQLLKRNTSLRTSLWYRFPNQKLWVLKIYKLQVFFKVQGQYVRCGKSYDRSKKKIGSNPIKKVIPQIENLIYREDKNVVFFKLYFSPNSDEIYSFNTDNLRWLSKNLI